MEKSGPRTQTKMKHKNRKAKVHRRAVSIVLWPKIQWLRGEVELAGDVQPQLEEGRDGPVWNLQDQIMMGKSAVDPGDIREATRPKQLTSQGVRRTGRDWTSYSPKDPTWADGN